MRAVPALILTGVGLLALSKLATLNTVQLLDLELADFTVDLSGIKVKMLATNQTSNPVTIDNLVGDVYLNDVLSGRIGPFTAVTIPAKGDALLNIRVDINPAVILIEAISIFNGSAGISATLKLVGTITADGIDIPFTTIRKLV